MLSFAPIGTVPIATVPLKKVVAAAIVPMMLAPFPTSQVTELTALSQAIMLGGPGFHLPLHNPPPPAILMPTREQLEVHDLAFGVIPQVFRSTVLQGVTGTRVCVAQFGTAYTGLTGQVGYTLYQGSGSVYQSRTAAGVSEIGSGTGIYITSVTIRNVANLGIEWDTGGMSPVYIADEINPGAPGSTVVNFGPNYSGLAGQVGFTLYNPNGSVYQARATAAVRELGTGTGIYMTVVNVPQQVGILWDTGGGSPVYAGDEVLVTNSMPAPPTVGPIGAGVQFIDD